jgi:hypothetical protein
MENREDHPGDSILDLDYHSPGAFVCHFDRREKSFRHEERFLVAMVLEMTEKKQQRNKQEVTHG